MIGPKIKTRMAELGIRTQTDLAERSGLSVQYINALIQGKRGARMGYRTQNQLAHALRVGPIFFSDDSSQVEKLSVQQASVEAEGAYGCPT